jgi:hypothetical protein
MPGDRNAHMNLIPHRTLHLYLIDRKCQNYDILGFVPFSLADAPYKHMRAHGVAFHNIPVPTFVVVKNSLFTSEVPTPLWNGGDDIFKMPTDCQFLNPSSMTKGLRCELHVREGALNYGIIWRHRIQMNLCKFSKLLVWIQGSELLQYFNW